MREVFFQDEDVLMAYDAGMADIAGDPDHMVTQVLHTGDLRPRSWFWTFNNVRPRPAGRGFPAGVLAALHERSPALRFTAPTQRAGDDRGATPPPPPPPSPALPEGLTGQFEVFVGLAQHRFFDRACAVTMARTLYDLLVAFLDTPALHPARVWTLGQRATVGHEILIVDRDFCIEGHTTVWRLGADLTAGQARAWTLRMLTDCTAKVVTAYATASPELLLDLHDIAPPTLDPALPAALHARAEHLRHHEHPRGVPEASPHHPGPDRAPTRRGSLAAGPGHRRVGSRRPHRIGATAALRSGPAASRGRTAACL